MKRNLVEKLHTYIYKNTHQSFCEGSTYIAQKMKKEKKNIMLNNELNGRNAIISFPYSSGASFFYSFICFCRLEARNNEMVLLATVTAITTVAIDAILYSITLYKTIASTWIQLYKLGSTQTVSYNRMKRKKKEDFVFFCCCCFSFWLKPRLERELKHITITTINAKGNEWDE